MRRYDDYRARSAYKLVELDDKYKFLKPGSIVIEAGAAPGSWTQVICQRLKLSSEHNMTVNPEAGLCIAVDIAGMQPVDGAICIGNADFTSVFTQSRILTWLDGRRADVVLSDMAPNDVGERGHNHENIARLVKRLMPFASQVLKKGGILIYKIFDGSETAGMEERLRGMFGSVKRYKPAASREASSEFYVICREYKGSGTMDTRFWST